MVASAAGHEEVVHLIASRFPDAVSIHNKAGLTAVSLPALSSYFTITPYS
jgi:hypothetical protein